MVGQLAALLVSGAGHSADAEVVQDAAAAAMPPGHDGGGTGRAEQPSGLEILGGLDTQLGGARWNAARVTIGLSTNRAVNEPPRRFSGRKVGGLYKEKAPVGAFSGHYETSRRFVDGSTLFTNQP